jgi:hypothetical protein
MTTTKKRKRKVPDRLVQLHKQRLTDLARTAHASAYNPVTHPDPHSLWASSPDDQVGGAWRYGWGGAWGTP